MTVAQGSRLGHYTILAPLGAGGMGEVWLAEDTTLKRKVALKVLPAGVATDPDRLARFQREAEAVAALSHPNIVTIHSIEQDGDIRFLTMERVEGQSLDQVIPRGGMPLGQVLEIGATLADALAASHEKGIIHRDLKPANIMLAGRERRVKVLDFGLAKLREEAAADGETTTAALSGEGRVLGTVAYMSPEQAEGKPVDARSDLFSLGIVLYEMATGERPFKGDTSISVLSAILRDTPKSVTELRADLPRELGRIVRRCLQKDVEDRYQTAKDIRSDLKVLRAETESGALEHQAAGIGAPASKPPRRGAKRRAARWAIGASALVLLTAAAAWTTWRLVRVPAEPARRPYESVRMRRLTDVGKMGWFGVSFDGRYVAYGLPSGDKESLRLRQIATGSDVEIVPPGDVHFNLAFTPDGNFLYYTIKEPGPAGLQFTLYRVPALGGPPRRLGVKRVLGLSVSRDDGRLAFVRDDERSSVVVVADADGGGERVLASRQRSDTRFSETAWSPDGRRLAAAFRSDAAGKTIYRLMIIDPQKGQETTLEIPGSTSDLAWVPDGFLLSARQEGEPGFSLWFVGYPGGGTRRITSDTSIYTSVAASADGRTIIAAQELWHANVWVVDADTGRAVRQLTSGRSAEDGRAGLAWTAEGRVLYTSMTDQGSHIWSVAAAGGQPQQITFGQTMDGRPTFSERHRLVPFLSSGVDRPPGIWCVGIDGGAPRLVVNRKIGQGSFSLTPDGRFAVYVEDGSVWRVALTGGSPEIVLNKNRTDVLPMGFWLSGSVSPDGRHLVGLLRKALVPGTTADVEFGLVDVLGREPWRPLKNINRRFISTWLEWRPDGRALAYLDGPALASDVWTAPLDGGPARRLTAFRDVLSFAWSPDARRLALARGAVTGDLVVLMDEGRK